jgi:hypothetical protein
MAWVVVVCLPPSEARSHVVAQHEARAEPFVLDLANRTAMQRIAPELADPEGQKFVELEVRRVENPKRLPLSFEVFYQDEAKARVRLGSFALFPPDNPGRFIVPTAGRLRAGGAIVVSLVVLREPGPDDRVRVTLDRITFRRLDTR